jgi:hypothetical protein
VSALVLILADCPAPPLTTGDVAGWPRLAAWEQWLARATRTLLPQRDWRAWLQQRVGFAGTTGAADVIAAALGRQHVLTPAGAQHYWLATPVHWTAGLDTVRLHPQGLLQLDVAEATQLVSDFGRVFVDSGWQLFVTGGRELLLAGEPQEDCDADDPALWCGLSPKAGMVRGSGAKALRQLGAEIEMWLYDHPVNRARDSSRMPTISALWLWGSGSAPLRTLPRAAAGLLQANDLYARSLWQLLNAPHAPLPTRWQALNSDERQTIVIPWSGAHPASVVQELEQQWIAPLIGDWSRGKLQSLDLVAGGVHYHLPRVARWRFWQRRRPWWETLLA